jgi:hypothetical protein
MADESFSRLWISPRPLSQMPYAFLFFKQNSLTFDSHTLSIFPYYFPLVQHSFLFSYSHANTPYTPSRPLNFFHNSITIVRIIVQGLAFLPFLPSRLHLILIRHFPTARTDFSSISPFNFAFSILPLILKVHEAATFRNSLIYSLISLTRIKKKHVKYTMNNSICCNYLYAIYKLN